MKITETDEHMEEQSANCSVASSTGTGSDKENPPPADMELQRRLRMLPASRNSTPRIENITPQSSNPLLKPQQLLAKSSSGLSSQMEGDWRKEFSDLKEHVDEARTYLQQEMAYLCDWNRKNIIEQMAQLSKRHMDNTQDIRDALDLLLRGDSFMQEFWRLQNENEMLKAELKYYKERERTESCEE